MPSLTCVQKTHGQHDEESDHDKHEKKQNLIGPDRGTNTAKVQQRDDTCYDRRPNHEWNPRRVHIVNGRRDPYSIDERQKQISRNIAQPARKSQVRIEALSDIGVGRSRGWKEGRHAPVTHGGDQYREHGNQDDEGKVAVREFLRHAIEWHRSNRLDEDDPEKIQVP